MRLEPSIVLFLLAAFVSPIVESAAAERLVLRDGSVIETRGPFKTRGSQVVFTAANGALQSLRLSDVDLEASRAPAVAPPAAPAPAPAAKEPVLVLTNKDIRPARRALVDEADAPTEEAAADTAAAPKAKPNVAVTSWRQIDNTVGGLEILGSVRNQGRELVTDLRVLATLYDEGGEKVAFANAFLGELSLAPGGTTTFRAVFPELVAFSGDPKLEVLSNSVRVRMASEEEEDPGVSGEEGES